MKVHKKQPNIFEFHDYRLYLKSALQYLCDSETFSSLREIARKAKISPAHLPLIMSGQRRVTPKLRKKILPHLSLSYDEKKYFDLLCIVADAETVAVRIEALKQIQKIRFYRKQNPRETEVFQYLARWYYVAIRELALLPGFKADPDWIQSRLQYPVSQREVSKALDFLIDHKFLVKNSNGTVTPPEKKIECKGEVYSIALAQLYRQSFDLAATSIDEVERDRRLIRGKYMTVPKGVFGQVKQILEDTLKQISELCDSVENAEEVYYVGVMSFPMTRNEKEEKI